jgi:hypothetical protein
MAIVGRKLEAKAIADAQLVDAEAKYEVLSKKLEIAKAEANQNSWWRKWGPAMVVIGVVAGLLSGSLFIALGGK